MIKKLTLLLVLMAATLGHTQEARYVDLGAMTFKESGQTYLAVTFKNEKKWHTYWKNPGDAGQSIKLRFTVNRQDTKLTELPWPAPKRYIEKGNMWAYGYSGKYAHFYQISDGLKNQEITIIGEWLVCKNICIPETKTITLKLNEQLSGSFSPHFSRAQILEEFNNLPNVQAKSLDVKFYLTKAKKSNALSLHYIIENANFEELSEEFNIVTPYHAFPFDYGHEFIYKDLKNQIIYGHMPIEWDGVYEEPVWELPEDGIFKKPIKARFLIRYPKSDKATIVEEVFSEFSLKGENQLLDTYSKLKEVSISVKVSNEGIWSFILFAFLGGLILNLMPCVLPVISLKLFSLISHSHESNRKILKHNLAYTLGVIFSFMVLATSVYFIKTSGEKIGWGFQLQSPTFVFAMMLLIFVMALNMFGLFEFRTPGGTKLGGTKLKPGFSGDFLNGVLATILSTPCSAPFLGSALPFAFTSSTINIYIIFVSVGIGLAFPFILTGLFPRTIKFLPKPGMWMDKLKKFLALSLILTAVWLYDVLATLVDTTDLAILINSCFVLIFFAFYFQKSISKNKILRVIFFLIPLFLVFNIYQSVKSGSSPESKQVSNESGQVWKKWTPQSHAQAITSKGYTFINFTAAWCLTCKVNKKLILNTSSFKKLVDSKSINLLEGDWTKRDDNITNFLRSFNIVGVPAYFVITPDGRVHSLGETISLSRITDIIK